MPFWGMPTVGLGVVSDEAAAYLLEQSLLFNGSTTYLNRTPSTAGNRKTWTFSCWVKLAGIGDYMRLFCATPSSGDSHIIIRNTGEFHVTDGGASGGNRASAALLRDPNAWYHLVTVFDTTNATANDRLRMYINGVRVTEFSSTYGPTNPTLNADTWYNAAVEHRISSDPRNNNQFFDGLMALPILVDGAALDATSFGEEDADGYWNPIDFTGATTNDFVPLATYSALVGNMTDGGGLAASFDGNKAQTDAGGSKSVDSLSTANATVGKQFSSTKTITQTCITGTTNRGYASGSYTGSLTIYLKSSDSGIGVSETVHDSVTFNNSNAINPKTLTGDGSSATYWWVEIEGATGELGLMAEVEFYEASAAAGFGTNGFELDYADTAAFGADVKTNTNTMTPTFEASYSSTSDVTTYTFASADLGTPDTDRYIVVGTGGPRSSAGARTVSSMTINGVSATFAGRQHTINNNGNEIWYAPVPTVATGDCGIAVWSVLNLGTIQDVQGDGTSTTAALSISISGGEGAVSFCHQVDSGNATAATWTTATERSDDVSESVYSYTSADYTFSAASNGTTITVDNDGGSDCSLLGVTFGKPNDNFYKANNFTAASQLSDTPTDSADDGIGNFARLNSLTGTPNWVFSNNNLTVANATESNHRLAYATQAVTEGKWYWEVTLPSAPFIDSIGVINMDIFKDGVSAYLSTYGAGWGYSTSVGRWDAGGGWVSVAPAPPTLTGSGVIGIALDCDNNKLWFRNASGWINSGDPAAGTGANFTRTTSVPVAPAFSKYANTGAYTFNFGLSAFTYTPPTGFETNFATQNLPAPTIANGSDYFNTVLYTGTGSTNSVTGVGFQPDFVWWKNRTDAAQHMLGDVVRGAGKVLASNSTGAELDDAAVYFSSLDSDGFTVETANVTNGSGDAMVAWCWKAGGTAVSNTVGSITSSVSANPTSGFSIATYTGIGSSGTVGHGLGAAPKFIIIKSRSNASTNWRVYHDGLGGITKYLLLNSTAAVGTASMWGTPGTTAFTIGGATYEVNETGQTYVAYCWAEVEGFSKFGSYTGNGSTDGPFIFTGFKPAFVLIKNTVSTYGWLLIDVRRDSDNPASQYLYANATDAEASFTILDVLSNGFKIRIGTGSAANNSTDTHIYAAFAEHPFQGGTADSRSQGRAR